MDTTAIEPFEGVTSVNPLYKPALRCLRVVREQAGLTVGALAKKTGWPPEVVEAVLERPEYLRLWDLCHEEHEDAQETCAATIRTLIDRDEVDHEMIFFLTTLGSRYLSLRRRLFGKTFDAKSQQAIVAALLQADLAPGAWNREGDASKHQEIGGCDLRDLLSLAADLGAEHPRVAGALLLAVAYSATRLKDFPLKLEYLVYVSLGLVRFPKEAQALSVRPASDRTAALGALLLHLSDVWRISFDARVLCFMEKLAGAIDVPMLPDARKKDLAKVYEAMVWDVVAQRGDAKPVRQALANAEKAYEQRSVSLEAVKVDFLTIALLALGKVKGWSTVSALVESGARFSAFLAGIPPVQELEGFPITTRIMRELRGGL